MMYVRNIFLSPSLFPLVNNSSSSIRFVMKFFTRNDASSNSRFFYPFIPLVIDFRLQLNFHDVIIRDNRWQFAWSSKDFTRVS